MALDCTRRDHHSSFYIVQIRSLEPEIWSFFYSPYTARLARAGGADPA